MPKYRMGNGLNVTPDKDLQMFKEMSAQGYHLSGTKWAGSAWEFTEGEPRDYDYMINNKRNFDEDDLAEFEECGWELIIDYPGLQIIRGDEGCQPYFSAYDNYDEMLEDEKSKHLNISIYMLIILAVLVIVELANLGSPLVTVIPGFFVLSLFLFNIIPYLGVRDTVKKHQ